jgi:hypothetical protein
MIVVLGENAMRSRVVFLLSSLSTSWPSLRPSLARGD